MQQPITTISPRLGEILVADGVVTTDDLDAALRHQAEEGGDLGEHLVADGAASRVDVYRALATQWGLPFRDLLTDPPDPAVATSVRHREALGLGWLACEETAGRLVVATSRRPDDALRDEIAVRFGPFDVDLVATTRWDLFRAVERLHQPAIRRQSGTDPAGAQAATPSGTDDEGRPSRTAAALLVAASLALVLMLAGPRPGLDLVLLGLDGVLVLAVAARAALVLRRPWLTQSRSRRERARRVRRSERGLTPTWPAAPADRDLPVYSVLVPATDGADAEDVRALLAVLAELDYPATRLDVLVLLAERDVDTAERLRAARPPAHVRLVVVPEGAAASVNRACNYGLAFARGRYLVRYDVGDRPEPGQLRRAVEAFRLDAFRHGSGGAPATTLGGLQAERRNRPAAGVAARLDDVVRSAWFDGALTGAEGLGALPLASSSHHVDADLLRAVGAWQPLLGAQAGDLGRRLTTTGHRVGLLASVTTTTPPADLRSWARGLRETVSGHARAAADALPATHRRSPTVGKAPRAGTAGSPAALLGLAVLPLAAFLLWPLVVVLTVAAGTTTVLGLDVVAPLTASAGLATLLVVHALSAALTAATTRTGGTRLTAPVAVLLDVVAWPALSAAAWRTLLRR